MGEGGSGTFFSLYRVSLPPRRLSRPVTYTRANKRKNVRLGSDPSPPNTREACLRTQYYREAGGYSLGAGSQLDGWYRERECSDGLSLLRCIWMCTWVRGQIENCIVKCIPLKTLAGFPFDRQTIIFSLILFTSLA